MSIRFKFRSSANFDSVDIEGRPSISIRELRSKIIRHKNLNMCQDFDLLFSDPLTGQDYNEENFQIPSDSSVIIKRVPAGSVPSARPIDSVEYLGMKNSNLLSEKSGEMDDFDDFGIDLCPVPEAIFPYSDLEFDKKNGTDNDKENIAGSRLGCQKLQVSDLSEAIPRGSNHSKTEEIIPQKKLEPKVEEHMKLGKVVGINPLAVQSADLPSELKCSLCNAFFKDAVMIPCCQHSFCQKCIRGVLIEKANCPKCSSRKCRVEDLLPNLSLRQAIEHFLESQNLVTASENALCEYAPDGESGIQAKDFSCAVTIVQKRPDHPLSPSATEKGSNQIMGESFYAKSLIRKNASLEGSGYQINNLAPGKGLKAVPSLHKVKQTGGERDGYAHHVGSRSGPGNPAGIADFQGENAPLLLPQTHLHGEGGGRSFPATARYRKADRTCYMCGAPDHFIRDCPIAASPHPMLQTGNAMYPGGVPNYASPYWNGTAFAPMRPYANMYGNPGMMPFNASMVPVTPFGVPPYMSSMYSHFPAPGGIMRMGGVAPPVGNRAEHPLTHSEYLELRDYESGGKLSNEYLRRRQPFDDEDEDFHKGSCYNVPDRAHEYKSHTEREKSGSYSGDNHAQRSRRKHQHDKHLDHDVHSVHDKHRKISRSSTAVRDRRLYHSERSNSEVEDMSNSSDRYDDGRHKQHHRSSRKHHERRGQCGSDSSWSRHQRQKEKDVKSRVDSDEKGFDQKRGSQLGSGVEPSSSGDQKRRRKERDHSRGSRQSRDGAKPIHDELCSDRWKMISPDEDCREGYRNPKRKRIL